MSGIDKASRYVSIAILLLVALLWLAPFIPLGFVILLPLVPVGLLAIRDAINRTKVAHEIRRDVAAVVKAVERS